MSHENDVRLAQSGDHAAFTRLIKGVEGGLYRISSSILKSRQHGLDATQEAILKAFVSLPKSAFTRLIKAIELNLYGVARSIVKQDEDCADAIQETILKAYRNILSLKEPAYFKTWIFRILINECNQILRKKKLTVSSEAIPEQSSSIDCYESIDLREAVNQLEESLRLVITLHYFEDIPLKQIAEMLETPEGTIKSRLYRARTLLAEYLQGPKERRISYESYYLR